MHTRRFTFNVAIAMNFACSHSISPTTSSTVAGNVPNRSRKARFTGVGNFGATRSHQNQHFTEALQNGYTDSQILQK